VKDNELDKLVAEKVMGWVAEEIPAKQFLSAYVLYKRPEPPHVPDYKWSPSTNIQDAWLVVERLNNSLNTITKVNNNSKIGYEVEMFKYDSEGDLDDVYKTHQETAPLAICITALKSVGIEMNQLIQITYTRKG
jgi:hypothetical protein